MNCLFHFAPLHLDPQPPAQLCPGVPARLGVRVHHLPLVLLVLHLEDDDDHHHNNVLLVKYLGGVLEPARQVGGRSSSRQAPGFRSTPSPHEFGSLRRE